jgi:acetolactate synthase I/II/III large subunit
MKEQLKMAGMKTSDHVVDTLIKAGVKIAFTLPGLGITWSLGSFYDHRDEIKIFLARSEQTASIMAQAYGKLTGSPALLMGQGPWISTTGAFGILEAHFSGSPMIVLTETSDYDGFGQYGVYQTMTGDHNGADIQASLRPITKYCTYATEPEDAVFGVQQAAKQAVTPRTGPAAVIMKTPIIRRGMTINPRARLYPTEGYLRYTPPSPDEKAMEELARLIDSAQLPVFIAGNGVFSSCCGPQLEALVKQIGGGIVTSYNAKGVVDETSEVCAGMLGTWGNPTANRVTKAADLLIILGASMGPDYTRFRDPEMIRPGDQKMAQVDIDPRNAGWVYPVDLPITADVKDVVDRLSQKNLHTGRRKERLNRIAEIKKNTGYDSPPRLSASGGTVHFTDIIAVLQDFLTAEDLLTLDAGDNRIWATHSLRIRHSNQLLVPGGVGGMGWGGPAAAAAKLVYPEKRVTCLTGDGGFLMTADVVASCAQHGLPVTFIVANNCGLGMVRDNMGPKRIAVDFGEVDFAKVGEGMGAKGFRVSSAKGLAEALREAHKLQQPVVIDVTVDPAASHRPATDVDPL